MPQSQTAALPRPQEEEETDKSKQAQTEQTYEKHYEVFFIYNVHVIYLSVENMNKVLSSN